MNLKFEIITKSGYHSSENHKNHNNKVLLEKIQIAIENSKPAQMYSLVCVCVCVFLFFFFVFFLNWVEKQTRDNTTDRKAMQTKANNNKKYFEEFL